jgi:hypothetical protein
LFWLPASGITEHCVYKCPAAAAVTRTLLIVRWGHRRGFLLLGEGRRIVDVAHFLMSPVVGAITACNKGNTETIKGEFWNKAS